VKPVFVVYRAKIKRTLARCLLVRCCECTKLNKVTVVFQDIRLGKAVAFKKPLQCHTDDHLGSTGVAPIVLCPSPLLPIAHEQRVSPFLFFCFKFVLSLFRH